MLADCTLSEEIRQVDQSHRFKSPHSTSSGKRELPAALFKTIDR
jgi:hypothetical protein